MPNPCIDSVGQCKYCGEWFCSACTQSESPEFCSQKCNGDYDDEHANDPVWTPELARAVKEELSRPREIQRVGNQPYTLPERRA